ncbi:hypothetical protein [Pyrobaculum sp.]|uniref:hypothetical protein n=1 Tax=Pyrobaculum sp. TaxID=2004705 RepID=UPI003D116B16
MLKLAGLGVASHDESYVCTASSRRFTSVTDDERLGKAAGKNSVALIRIPLAVLGTF